MAADPPTPPALPARRSTTSVPVAAPPALPARTLPPPALPPRVARAAVDRAADGLTEEQLHVLLRRFDKEILHVQSLYSSDTRISSIPPLLDLQPAPHASFAPEKLRANFERLYASVVVGLMRCAGEVKSLRSWENGTRTGCFLAVYVGAWSAHLVWATFLMLISVLVLFPSSRQLIFPRPSTIPLGANGGKSPTEEEEVERDATAFADGLEALAHAGLQHDNLDLEGYELEVGVKEDSKARKGRKEKERKAKKMETIGGPVMQLTGDLVDGWERWANALSPNPPFPARAGQISIFLKLLLPIIVSTTFVSDYIFSSAMSFMVGFVFFGGPVIKRMVRMLDKNVPGWQEKIELRNGILAGCPTDAQLTLRLLRDAEAASKPLAPPPPPPSSIVDESDADSLADSVLSDGQSVLVSEDGKKVKAKARTGFGFKLAGAVKSAAAFTEESAAILGGHKKVDWNSAVTSTLSRMNVPVLPSRAAKTLLGFIPAKDEQEGGPSSYFVYHAGRPGHILIHPFNNFTRTPARITFSTLEDVPASVEDDAESPTGGLPDKKVRRKRVRAEIKVDEITALRKNGLGGWQGRMLVNVAVAGFQGVGGAGLEIKVCRSSPATTSGLEGSAEGEEVAYSFGGIMRRDELFDRLIALGEQRWECL